MKREYVYPVVRSVEEYRRFLTAELCVPEERLHVEPRQAADGLGSPEVGYTIDWEDVDEWL